MTATDTYHSLVGDLEGASAGHPVVDGAALVLVGHQVAVQVVLHEGLGDLVPEDHGVGDSRDDGAGDYTKYYQMGWGAYCG